MDDYPLAMSFGSELVYQITTHFIGCNYFPNTYMHNPLISPRFDSDQVITDAVVNLMCLGKNDISKCYYEGLAVIDGNAKIFAKLALEAAVAYFPSGYTHPAFLSYCAMVIGVATLHVEIDRHANVEQILDAAAGVISTVLFGHLLGSGFSGPAEWTETMLKVAGEFNEFAEPRVRGMKMKQAKSNSNGRRSEINWMVDS